MNYELIKSLFLLLVNLNLGLDGCQHAPHLIEGVHVEGQVILFSFVVGNGRIGITVELDHGVDKLPHLPVVSVEDMGTVLVYVDAFYLLAIDIAAQMRTLIYHQTSLASLFCPVCKSGSKETRSYYQIIVFSHNFQLSI